MVSKDIRRILAERARFFHIVLEDVSITQLTFSKEYTAAVEAKQVAQQDAERAKFVVRGWAGQGGAALCGGWAGQGGSCIERWLGRDGWMLKARSSRLGLGPVPLFDISINPVVVVVVVGWVTKLVVVVVVGWVAKLGEIATNTTQTLCLSFFSLCCPPPPPSTADGPLACGTPTPTLWYPYPYPVAPLSLTCGTPTPTLWHPYPYPVAPLPLPCGTPTPTLWYPYPVLTLPLPCGTLWPACHPLQSPQQLNSELMTCLSSYKYMPPPLPPPPTHTHPTCMLAPTHVNTPTHMLSGCSCILMCSGGQGAAREAGGCGQGAGRGGWVVRGGVEGGGGCKVGGEGLQSRCMVK